MSNYQPIAFGLPIQLISKKSRKIHFTAEEDEMLIFLVSKFGEDNWNEIIKYLPNRNVRQCRERWNKYLNPNLKTDEWTKEEEELLMSKVKEFGTKWKLLSSFFPGRTDINVKSRYLLLQRKNQRMFRAYQMRIHYNQKYHQNIYSQQQESTQKPPQNNNSLDILDSLFDDFEMNILL